ncbi:MAG: hypothetical protein ACR2RD_06575, partial [Woeseiaceae bacterium]
MPDFTTLHFALFVIAILISGSFVWVLRGKRARQEKAAINAGWKEQMEALRIEHHRLVDQNKGLMDQISQYQASNRDAKNRSKELAESVQAAFARRDELQ